MSDYIKFKDRYSNLCFTHVSTGYCPFQNRCCFIHDPRICGTVKSKIKTKDLKSNDTLFYWPRNTKNSINPNVEYEVKISTLSDKFTKTTWENFIKFLDEDFDNKKKNTESISQFINGKENIRILKRKK